MAMAVDGSAASGFGEEAWQGELAELLPGIAPVRSLGLRRASGVLLAQRGEGLVVVKALAHKRGRRRIQRGAARRETSMLQAAQGAHVVRLEEVAIGTEFTFLVMEHLPLSTLRGRLREPWSGAELVAAGLGVTAALARLHGAGILFNDFKPRNVGVAPSPSPGTAGGEQVKLLDFGHARTLDDTRARHCLCGTVDYAPPEAWGPGLMGTTSDVWAWGRSWHLLASGHYFERVESFRQLLRAGRAPLPPVDRVSRSPLPGGLATLIDAALDPDPDRRPADGREVQERLWEIARAEWGEDLATLTRFALPLREGEPLEPDPRSPAGWTQQGPAVAGPERDRRSGRGSDPRAPGSGFLPCAEAASGGEGGVNTEQRQGIGDRGGVANLDGLNGEIGEKPGGKRAGGPSSCCASSFCSPC